MCEKEINASSANAQSNGWTFQYVAALVIYLENMNMAKSFCVEGSDDIVVYLRDDNNIYAQAKCSLNQDMIIKNHMNEIMESIRTLSGQSNPKELISVFNFHKPLGDDNAFSHYQFLDKKSFNGITEEKQREIKENASKYGYVIEFDKLKFWFIRFEGDEPENALKEYLNGKLFKLKPNVFFSTDEIMEKWLNIIQLNARDKKNVIETDVMTGTLFGKILSASNFKSICEMIDIEIDVCYEEEVESFFKDYFNKNSQNFRIYNDITYEFSNYVKANKVKNNEAYKKFVDFFCNISIIPQDIKDFFCQYDEPDSISLDVYKLFVAYVCYKRNVIQTIKGLFNYEAK